jgi:hypothetical protein
MKLSLESSNVTIVANSFNPSVLRESWLRDRNLLRDDDLAPGYVFTPQAVHVPTARFTLTIVPQFLIFAPLVADAAALTQEIVGPIVRALPHTPFSGVGLNFQWQIDPEGETIAALSRRLFAQASFVLASDFESDDAQFGLYMSKDLPGSGRLKLDMKPIITEPTKLKRLTFVFNFHSDASGDTAAAAIEAFVNRWAEFSTMAEGMMNRVVGL